VNARTVNRKTLESLIKSGAFDAFGERHVLLGSMDVLLAYAQRMQKQQSSGQTDLFGSSSNEVISRASISLIADVPSVPDREMLQWERDLLGLYLSQHPLAAFEAILQETTIALTELQEIHDGKNVTIGGSILDMREITTKNGQKMAFVKIADKFGEIELILFPGMYQQTLGIWERDRVVFVKGKVNAKDRDGNATSELKILVDDAREITTEQAAAYQPTGKKVKIPKQTAKKSTTKQSNSNKQVSERVYVRMQDSSDNERLMKLKSVLDAHKGAIEVVLVLGDEDNKQVLKLPTRIDPSDAVIDQLKQIFSADAVKLH
jgi:DNA polymerase-3 subunit alpha